MNPITDLNIKNGTSVNYSQLKGQVNQISSGRIIHDKQVGQTTVNDGFSIGNQSDGEKSSSLFCGGMKTMSGDLSSMGEIFHISDKYRSDINELKAALSNNKQDKACAHFSAAVQSMVMDGVPMDVNALVQQVLRESYVDTTADLQFYADKVKYFNEAKKQVREYVQDLRDFKTSFNKAAQEAGFSPADPPSASDDNYLEWVNFQREFIEDKRRDSMSSGTAAGMSSVVSSYKAAVTAARTEACSGPGIESVTTKDGWTEIVDKDGYKIKTNVPDGDQVQIYGPDGKAIVEIWGDPHVDEGFDGSRNDWHFGDDSTFILPNGTKICINTEEANSGSGIFYSKGVDVLSGSGHAAVGQDPVTQTKRTATKSDDRAEWDMNHADTKGTSGGVFALPKDSTSWAKLGSDGKFYDIKNCTFDEYKAAKSVAVTSTVVDIPAAAMSAAQSTDKLKTIASNANYANSYPDTDSGTIARDVGIPNMIPPAGVTSIEEIDNLIDNWEEKLSSIGDDSQLANTDLQNVLQKQQQTLQMMSNISKALSDTALAVIRKIG